MKRSVTLVLMSVILGLIFSACGEQGTVARRKVSEVDSLLNAAYKAHDYAQMLSLCDTFEMAGDISTVKLNYWRGYACSRQQQQKMAEIYWKKVVESEVWNKEDYDFYSMSASRLANLLLIKGDYEGTLKVATAALEYLDKIGRNSVGDYANLLTSVGGCQLQLGMTREAAASYERAYQNYQQIIQADSCDANFKSAVIGMINITTNCLTTHHYEEAKMWTDRFEALLNRYDIQPFATADFSDKQRARVNLYRATALQQLGDVDEAAAAYQKALVTDYAKTGDGHIEANEYLMVAHRWQEAAHNFRDLDSQMKRYGMVTSIDNIQKYMIPKFRANLGAGLKDSVIAVGKQICDGLDSAIVWAKRDEAAELATIYDSHQKEAKIAQQQADMSYQRLLYTGVALVLVIAFFLIYTLHRRAATRRLASAHASLEEAHTFLKAAYDELEETTVAKERIESELRIARDIQHSIVPDIFPEHENLDMYACMTPAKIVGGDLYDYLLADDHLYFCLGDVSGKGVPASLFMAQAARLFRALAKEKFSPVNIATLLNTELSEGNDQGMFVTMFIGLLDLKTSRLEFCNAGHNPPVFGDHFLEVEPNAPIGLWPELEYVGEEIPSVKGGLLFLYTDGLNEAENRQQEQFGDNRLLEFLKKHPTDRAQQVIESLGKEVENHRDGADPNDDLTMMCIRVC